MRRTPIRRLLAKATTAPSSGGGGTNGATTATATSNVMCAMFRGALKVAQCAVSGTTTTTKHATSSPFFSSVRAEAGPEASPTSEQQQRQQQGQEQQRDNRQTTEQVAARRAPAAAAPQPLPIDTSLIRTPDLTQSKVPATRLGRAAGFASMFTQLGVKHVFGGVKKEEGRLLGDDSHELIAATLSRMRGAVMKLGQMLSIQDEGTVPSSVTRIFSIVRDQAYVMPDWQLSRVLDASWGDEWRSKKDLVSFSEKPIAAASFGQVHHAVIAAPPPSAHLATMRGTAIEQQQGSQEQQQQHVAVKIQFPGVAASIDSDVANLRMLASLGVVPSGLFVGNILDELKKELKEECNYLREAAKQEHYRELLAATPRLRGHFNVPRVHRGHSTETILTTDFVQGVPIEKAVADLQQSCSQEKRNQLAERMLELTLYELFVWCFMQTDPNFSNFLYDPRADVIHLLDFGAARSYDLQFIRDYLDVVHASAICDRDTVIQKSIALGFLTGQESSTMLDAHVASVYALGRPFRQGSSSVGGGSSSFDFKSTNIPMEVQSYVPTMLKLRLKPPPTPIYSLHRRLSGTILLCTKMGAQIDSSGLFWRIRDEALQLHGSSASSSSSSSSGTTAKKD